MQKLLKSFILTAIALYFTTVIIPGFIIQPGLINILVTTLVLALLNTFIRPLIRLLLLPVNLLTLGAFRWLINIILLYLLTLIMPEVEINGFLLTEIPLLGNLLPQASVGPFIAIVLTSIALSLSLSFLLWIAR